MKISGAIDFNAPALNYARKDLPLLEADASVEKALETIRREGVGERVIYFYAVDERKRLLGVVPTRRLLTAGLATQLREIMVPRVIALPAEATVLEACEFFVLYKFLAFPVVDAERRVIGIVDTDVFMEGVLESGESEVEGARDDRDMRGRRAFFEHQPPHPPMRVVEQLGRSHRTRDEDEFGRQIT